MLGCKGRNVNSICKKSSRTNRNRKKQIRKYFLKNSGTKHGKQFYDPIGQDSNLSEPV